MISGDPEAPEFHIWTPLGVHGSQIKISAPEFPEQQHLVLGHLIPGNLTQLCFKNYQLCLSHMPHLSVSCFPIMELFFILLLLLHQNCFS